MSQNNDESKPEVAEATGAATGRGDAKAAPPMLATALRYAAAGFVIFPCGEKRAPLTKRGFYDATDDEETIRDWWARWPAAMIGLPTGQRNDLIVVDIDVKNGRDGFKSIPNWRELTPVAVQTPSGGVHLYFADEPAIRCGIDVLPGVDVRAEGGYAIAAGPGYRLLDNGDDKAVPPPLPPGLLPAQGKHHETASGEAAGANGHDGAASSSGAGSAGGGGERGAKAGDLDELAVAAAALRVISPNGSYRGWFEIACALHFEFGESAFTMFDSFSARSTAQYEPEGCRKKWAEAGKIDAFGMGTLVMLANQSDPDWRALIAEERAGLGGAEAKAKPFEWWDAGEDDRPIPPRGWLLGNSFCRRFVSSLIADGGVGKTAVRYAQYLCSRPADRCSGTVSTCAGGC